MTWYDMTIRDMTWLDKPWYDMMSYDVIKGDMTWHTITEHDLTDRLYIPKKVRSKPKIVKKSYSETLWVVATGVAKQKHCLATSKPKNPILGIIYAVAKDVA